MKIERYQSYKDSGIEWLGEIPEHWKLSRIKQKGTVRGRVGWKALKADEYVDKGYIFLSTPNIKEKDIDFENVNYITYERYIESPEIMIQEGDILLAKDGSTLGTTNIVFSLPREATVNSSIAVIRFKKEIFKKYIYYQILSEFIQNKISLKKIGMGVPHLFQRDINNFFILLPPLPEQKTIANYLDTKTAQIDRKIDLLTQKANLYSNLKQSLINETVTSGLDKSVPMKDSGIEWLGEIPEHWEVKHFKQFSTMKGRIGWQGLKHSEFIDEGPFLITGMNFKAGKINWNEVYHINNERYEQAPEIQLRENDILMTKDGTIGKLLYVDNIPAPHKASLNSHLLVFRPIKKSYYPKYLYYQLDSSTFQNYVEVAKAGTTFFGISQASVGRYIAVLPPLSEQKAIADYLDTKTAQIDQIIQTINTQIEKLKEFRKTLINDVVTGKIKV